LNGGFAHLSDRDFLYRVQLVARFARGIDFKFDEIKPDEDKCLMYPGDQDEGRGAFWDFENELDLPVHARYTEGCCDGQGFAHPHRGAAAVGRVGDVCVSRLAVFCVGRAHRSGSGQRNPSDASRRDTRPALVVIYGGDRVYWSTRESVLVMADVAGGSGRYSHALATATPAPAGLSFDSTTGIFYGHARVAEDFQFSVLVRDAASGTITTAVMRTVVVK
jgi:hypothetical protein